MKISKNYLMIAVIAGVMFTTVFTITQMEDAVAGQGPPDSVPVNIVKFNESRTHMGQRPSDHVTLQSVEVQSGSCARDVEFYRIFPDGSRADVEFMVPEGRYLVVTDYQISLRGPFGPGDVVRAQLEVSGTAGGSGRYLMSSDFIRAERVSNELAAIQRTVQYQSGFLVGAGSRLCPRVSVTDSTGARELAAANIVLGYLIDE